MGRSPITQTNRKRIHNVLIMLVVAHFFMVARAIYVELWHGDDLRERRLVQSKRIVPLHARRGMILDNEGNKLAVDVPYMSIYAHPSEITNHDEYVEKLSGPLGMSGDDIRELISDPEKNSVWLVRHVSEKTADAVKELNLRGIGFSRDSKRYYPHAQTAMPVVGLLGESDGLTGVEFIFNKQLKGENGYVVLERGLGGINVPDSTRELKPAKNGEDVHLTINLAVQHFVYDALEQAVNKFGAKAGSAIAIQPKTGRILGMASYPVCDPNDFKKCPQETYRNRSIGVIYEIGSCMKPIVVAAAIDKGIVDPYAKKILCEDGMRVGGYNIREAHGVGLPAYLSPYDIVIHSYNSGTARIGLMMGKEMQRETFLRFHFGKAFRGLGLNNQQNGLLAPMAEVRDSTIATNSFGHGIGVTQLQMAVAMGALCNGGMLMNPTVIEKVVDSEGNVVSSFEPKPIRRVIKEDTAKLMRTMLVGAVEEGTGKAARIPGYAVGGKTGTAIMPRTDGRGYTRDVVSSFVGFAPAENPEILVMVTIERPQRGLGYYGSQVAAPAAGEIMKKALWRMNVPPADIEGGMYGFQPDTEIPND
ncbi:MAG: Stage V sporulation protein D [bacterium ADurb.Bin236]|nr:MAG: Stage V sporulation protein D [bacterium ADurb.Bin236]HOY63906.1 penicillin-binding protein 2 [bacterium]HPN93575.1 penicillin-binding protein 2 [bacterium]